MVRISFAPAFHKHVSAATLSVDAETLSSALESAFQHSPKLRGYVLDDQNGVRPHVTIFINNQTIKDRDGLSDRLNDRDEVFVFQALSGG